MDAWLGRRLAATLVDARLVEGLAHFNAPPKTAAGTALAGADAEASAGAGADADAANLALGPLGWRLLRGLLCGNPTKRLTVGQVLQLLSTALRRRALNCPRPI